MQAGAGGLQGTGKAEAKIQLGWATCGGGRERERQSQIFRATGGCVQATQGLVKEVWMLIQTRGLQSEWTMPNSGFWVERAAGA